MQGRATHLRTADEQAGVASDIRGGKSPKTSPDSGSMEAALGSAAGG